VSRVVTGQRALTTRKLEDDGYEWILWMRDLIMPDPYFQSNDDYRGSV
jgi:hypothetical protein